MISEMADKHISRGGILVKKLLSVSVNPKEPTVTISGDVIKITCGTDIVEYTGIAKLKGDKTDIASAVLRYKALIMEGQQWSVPQSTYSHFINKFRIDLEGFASPFNTQIGKKGHFCSMFEEDRVFGSIGNFFDVDLTLYRSIINPPFIESLIEKVVEKIRTSLNAPLMCVVVPSWLDAKFYIDLTDLANKNNGKIFVLRAGKHHYEHGNKRITAKFSSTWFCFGKLLTPNILKDLVDYFRQYN